MSKPSVICKIPGDWNLTEFIWLLDAQPPALTLRFRGDDGVLGLKFMRPHGLDSAFELRDFHSDVTVFDMTDCGGHANVKVHFWTEDCEQEFWAERVDEV
ncbi:MAG: hypothetical protein KDC35_17535 [Acidobacteria bacterium]|nr:hypothetical protein [Acidobacteriota bacterium]